MDYDKALQHNPNNREVLLARANIYISQENYEYALKDINTLLELEPENGTLYTLSGDMHFALGNYGKALDSYISALDYLPDTEDKEKVYLALGDCSFNLEQYENTIEYYSKYLETADDNEKVDKGKVYFYRGVSHIQLEKYEEAVNDFSSAIELSYQPELSAFQ